MALARNGVRSSRFGEADPVVAQIKNGVIPRHKHVAQDPQRIAGYVQGLEAAIAGGGPCTRNAQNVVAGLHLKGDAAEHEIHRRQTGHGATVDGVLATANRSGPDLLADFLYFGTWASYVGGQTGQNRFFISNLEAILGRTY